jgi:signal transduction histidine kinase
MTALELITLVSQAIYVAVFVLLLWRYISAPTPAHLDMMLFFGILAFVIVESRLATLIGFRPPEWFSDTIIVLVVALPYILLRLLDDFTTVPPILKRAAEFGFLVLSVAVFIQTGTPYPAPFVFAIVTYLAAFSLYSGARFILAARRAEGVTRRRLQAISFAAILFAVQIVASGVSGQLAEPDRTLLAAIGQVIGLLSALSFFLGFAPPPILRRAWQAPELREFLTRAASLPRLPTTLDIVRELERGASAATGSDARLALWQEDERKLRSWRPDSDEPVDIEPGQYIAGRAFEQQQTIFSAQPHKDDPHGAERYREGRIGAIIATPITAGERRVGVLVLLAERPPIFALSDRELAQLLADQAAVILESRMLIDHAARVRAREEATRLKEDFLSAAAHDLKTPLTTVVAQAQFLERRALRDPSAPSDVGGLQRIVREAQRLSTLVTDLLDATRMEQGRLVADREPTDLGALVSGVVARQHGTHPVHVDVRGAVVGSYDSRRIEQVVENLVENAKKYSPEATPVSLTVWQQDGEARITVRDRGIGIPAADLPGIFERFSRASNVNDRKFHGMGLGLYICRGIIEEHGGRIWAESEIGKGSTFHVALPLGAERRLN